MNTEGKNRLSRALTVKAFARVFASIASAIFLSAAVTSSHAVTLLQDSFDYPDGSLTNLSPDLWLMHSGGGTGIFVVDGKLQVSGLLSDDVHALLMNGPYTTNGPIGALYAGFDFSVTSLPTDPNCFAHFFQGPTGGSFAARIFVSPSSSPGYYRVGAARLVAGTDLTNVVADLVPNATYKLVCRYELNTGFTTLWLNPVSEDSLLSVQHTNGAIIPSIDSFAFRQAAGSQIVMVDNLSVGTTFADVASWHTSAPEIIGKIPDQTVNLGDVATFTVPATGSPPLTYQWRKNGIAIQDATDRTLSLASVGVADCAGYSVLVLNQYGSATSDSAQLTVSSSLTVVQTNRSLTTEVGPTTIPAGGTNFVVFTNDNFQSRTPIDTSKPTVIMTHGWNSASSDWPWEMAYKIEQRLGANKVNLIAWDWSADARSEWYDLGKIAGKTPGQGLALGTNLAAVLGSGYSQPIHFIGHSLGTLVNAAAANYIHSHGFSSANTQMTLCDDAEIAWGVKGSGVVGFSTTLLSVEGIALDGANSRPWWGDTLPANCAWADSYITLCGLLHPNAANAVLTWDTPIGGISDTSLLLQEYYSFHDYSAYFYIDTIVPLMYDTGGVTNATYLGFISSFEGGGSASRQPVGTYFYQPPSSANELNLVTANYVFANSTLNARLGKYLEQWVVPAGVWGVNAAASGVGYVVGRIETGANRTVNAVWNLVTGGGGSSQTPSPFNSRTPPLGTNTPAYVWSQISIPPDAAAMSFDFILQGDGKQDSFQAALNGTNIFSVETLLVSTNVALNSGMIDVTPYAGQTAELFLGIVGGTSTNASMTVSNIQFQSIARPALQASRNASSVTLTWPFTANGYSLESSGTLGQSNSWTVVTNAPVIIDFQNTVSNQISPATQFYRLRKQ